jgi:hypothetical protein
MVAKPGHRVAFLTSRGKAPTGYREGQVKVDRLRRGITVVASKLAGGRVSQAQRARRSSNAGVIVLKALMTKRP